MIIFLFFVGEIKISNYNLLSVNLHFWPYCNMKCKYCFANFKDLRNLFSKEEWIEIIQQLYHINIKKINFVGGEPTLCPYLGDLIHYSKNLGLITSVVSNGTGITREFIEKYGRKIDWIGLSLDSSDEKIQKSLGRGTGSYVGKIISKSKMVKEAGIKLKVNTVVNRLNFLEDMTHIISEIKPDRWKVFQMLEIQGMNNASIKNLLITTKQFSYFVIRHKNLNPIIEDNNQMVESYLMIDPTGRFYQNSNNKYHYSRPILEVGINEALNEINFNCAKFVERGGIYAW